MRRSNLQETDDLSIISSAVQGDRSAYGALYERHVGRVFRHALYLTGDPELAQDITAQTSSRPWRLFTAMRTAVSPSWPGFSASPTT